MQQNIINSILLKDMSWAYIDLANRRINSMLYVAVMKDGVEGIPTEIHIKNLFTSQATIATPRDCEANAHSESYWKDHGIPEGCELVKLDKFALQMAERFERHANEQFIKV